MKSLILAICLMASVLLAKAPSFPGLAKTPGHQAVEKGDLAALKILLAANPKVLDELTHLKDKLLHNACRRGHLDIVKYLIEVKKIKADQPNGNDYTPLFYAIMYEHKEVVSYLINKHADVNYVCGKGNDLNPLCKAAKSGKLEIVKLLVINGADINGVCNGSLKKTPLDIARDYKKQNIIDYFIDLNAKTGAQIKFENKK